MPSKTTKSRTSSTKTSIKKTPIKKGVTKAKPKAKNSTKSTITAKRKSPGLTTSTKKTTPKKKTRLSVHCNVGFENDLYLRGQGAGLNWNKGIRLKNISPDEWIWETTSNFKDCEFKVLINDTYYEAGNNHAISHGANVHYTPTFS